MGDETKVALPEIKGEVGVIAESSNSEVSVIKEEINSYQ